MPVRNEAGAMLSPGTSTAYDTVFEQGMSMPAPQDPGWITCLRDSDVVRVIRVHGPFDLVVKGIETHCPSGWLGVDSDGTAYVVLDSDDLSELPPGHSEVS